MQTGVFPFDRYLKEYDVWEFHPLDQGGRLVHLQLIGSEKDADIVDALRRPEFFAPWGKPIRWDRLETTELEKSVWLNRWYYLPSFARLFSITGERPYLDDLLKLFRQWTADNPVPPDLPAYFQNRKYIWRDMQVAWRTQNLILCYFLGRDGFREAEQRELRESIQTHARVLLAYFGTQSLTPGNHQSHGALAMLLAGVLFPEMAESAALRGKALGILHYHLETAFFADGNSVELCPGYYPFIAANFRDAYLLCTANGISLTQPWHERLTQFYNFMQGAQQPDGTMPPINDSSEVPVGPSLRILGELLGMQTEPPMAESVRFADSHQAVMRDGSGRDASYVFLDAGAGAKWPCHRHAGKLGFHYWHGGRAFLVDSGVCNYDEALRGAWYLTAAAHNTILVDGLGDSEAVKRSRARSTGVGSCLSGWHTTPECVHATMASTAFESLETPVRWTRQILLFKHKFLVLVDHLRSASAHDYSWEFHFAPTTLQLDASRKRLVTGFGEQNLVLAPFQPETFTNVEIALRHINQNSRNVAAPVGRFAARASDMTAVFLMLPVNGVEFPPLELEITTEEAAVLLEIHVGRQTIRLNITDSGTETAALVTTVTKLAGEVAKL